MGKYEINLKKETELIYKLYLVDKEVRDFIDDIYLRDYKHYRGELKLAIRHNIKAINDFIESRDLHEE